MRAVVVVTSDKCYENREQVLRATARPTRWAATTRTARARRAPSWSTPRTGGRSSAARTGAHGVRLASARAGNVIGGGDWAADRIVPDCVRALVAGARVAVRNPGSIRPWQHVLEPLGGYLMLAARLLQRRRDRARGGWNFGPRPRQTRRRSAELVNAFIAAWGAAVGRARPSPARPHEASVLRLDHRQGGARRSAGDRAGTLDEAHPTHGACWYRQHMPSSGGGSGERWRDACLSEIRDYESAVSAARRGRTRLRAARSSSSSERYHAAAFPRRPFVPGETPRAGRRHACSTPTTSQRLVDSALDFWLTTGRFAEEFERQLARFVGAAHALLVNSGSSANLLAVSALTSPKLGGASGCGRATR